MFKHLTECDLHIKQLKLRSKLTNALLSKFKEIEEILLKTCQQQITAKCEVPSCSFKTASKL